MCVAKVNKLNAVSDSSRIPGEATSQQHDSLAEQSSTTSLDESFLLLLVHSSDSESESEAPQFSEEEAKESYDEWVSSQPKSVQEVLAINLMDTFRTPFGLTNVAAAYKAGLVVGYSDRVIRSWRRDYYSNRG